MKNTTIAITVMAIATTAAIAFGCFAGCAKKTVRQTASAHLDQEGTTVTATVDLTGGYSCDFAKGAVYIYDKENLDGVEPVAYVITLEKDVYEDYVKAAGEDKGSKSFKDGVIFDADGRKAYICKAGSDAYFAIFTDKANAGQIEQFVNRVSVKPGV